MGFIDDISDKVVDANKRMKKKEAENQEFDPNITFDGQKVEYKIVEIDRKLAGVLSTKAKNPEVKMNRMAAEGWRLVDTINEDNGGTQYLVFEREIETKAKSQTGNEWAYYDLATDDDTISVMLDDGSNEAIFDIDENGVHPRSEDTVEEYGTDWVNRAVKYLQKEFDVE